MSNATVTNRTLFSYHRNQLINEGFPQRQASGTKKYIVHIHYTLHLKAIACVSPTPLSAQRQYTTP